jgi:hypothetical protein
MRHLAAIALTTESERLAAALRALGEADLIRLRRIAEFRARELPGVQWSDLLNEAVLRALDGSRRRPEGVPLVVFLAGVMRSLADEHWRQHRARRLLFADAAGEQVADDRPGPDRAIFAWAVLRAIDAAFADDAEALQVISAVVAGHGAAAIQRLYALDETRYATIRRRIRRKLLKLSAEDEP